MAPSEAAASFDRMNAGGSSMRGEAQGERALEAWKYRPASGGQQNQYSSSGDLRFVKDSQLDSQILTQALQRELSSRKEFSARCEDKSTPKSLAETLSHCFSGQALSKTSPASDMEAAKSQLHQNSELFIRALQGGSFHLQYGCNSGDARSFVSTSDARERHSLPGSPLNNSCANSSNAMAVGEAADSEPTLSSVDARGYSTQASEEMNAPGFGSAAPRFGTAKAAPGELEEQAQAFVGKDPRSSAIPSAWAKTRCDGPQAALGSQASVGGGAAKISKRRSRASSKAPVTVLSADATNFRAMVQKLTGIPAPSAPQSGLHWWGSNPSSVSVLKPQPTRPVQHIQAMPTLDTSALLLFDGVSSALSQDPRLIAGDSADEHGFFPGLSFPQQTSQQGRAPWNGEHASLPNFLSCPSALSSEVGALLPYLLSPFQHQALNHPSASPPPPPPTLWDTPESGIVRGGFINDILRNQYCPERSRGPSPSIRLGENPDGRGAASNQATPGCITGGRSDPGIRHAAALESLFMATSERMDSDLPGITTLHPVDSWLSCDGGGGGGGGGGDHAPAKVELAHTA